MKLNRNAAFALLMVILSVSQIVALGQQSGARITGKLVGKTHGGGTETLPGGTVG